MIHYIFSSESLPVVNSLQIVNSLRVLFLVCRGPLGFWSSPSSRERTQWVPLGLLFVCQSELTEFFFAELTKFDPKLSEAQWVLFSETVLSKQYSARIWLDDLWPYDGNEWKKYRVVPRAQPLRPFVYAYFKRSGNKGDKFLPRHLSPKPVSAPAPHKNPTVIQLM